MLCENHAQMRGSTEEPEANEGAWCGWGWSGGGGGGTEGLRLCVIVPVVSMTDWDSNMWVGVPRR
jgi:hypothetical protein